MPLLLQPGERLFDAEEDIPPSVQRTLRFFDALGIPVGVTRNPIANGCTDAAAKRLRNGHRGIPVCDELKSVALAYCSAERNDAVAICHIAAHHRVDLPKIRRILRATRRPTWISEGECVRRNIGFGRMNPFVRDVQHMFDAELAIRTGTMMTNGGDRTWAVEFSVAALIKAMSDAIVADIAETVSVNISDCENTSGATSSGEIQ